MSETAHQEKIYDQAELDQAIKEAGFATEPHRRLIDEAFIVIAQNARLFGRTKLSTQWVEAYKEFDGGS